MRRSQRNSKSENRIKISKQIYIRRSDMELRYVDDVGLPGRFPHQRIENDVWDSVDLHVFFSNVLMALDGYKSLSAALAETKSDCVPSIDNFVRSTALASYKGLSDEKLAALVKKYEGQLNGVVHLTAYIDGICISESPLVISDWMVLRRPVPEDMAEYVKQGYGVGGIYGPKGWAFFRVVGEFNFGPSFEMGQDHLLRILAALYVSSAWEASFQIATG